MTLHALASIFGGIILQAMVVPAAAARQSVDFARSMSYSPSDDLICGSEDVTQRMKVIEQQGDAKKLDTIDWYGLKRVAKQELTQFIQNEELLEKQIEQQATLMEKAEAGRSLRPVKKDDVKAVMKETLANYETRGPWPDNCRFRPAARFAEITGVFSQKVETLFQGGNVVLEEHDLVFQACHEVGL